MRAQNVQFPEKGLVYDYYVDEAQCLMVPWEDKVPKFQYFPGACHCLVPKFLYFHDACRCREQEEPPPTCLPHYAMSMRAHAQTCKLKHA